MKISIILILKMIYLACISLLIIGVYGGKQSFENDTLCWPTGKGNECVTAFLKGGPTDKLLKFSKSAKFLPNLNFYLYNKEYPNGIMLNPESCNNPIKKIKTVVLVHGFTQNRFGDMPTKMTNAFLSLPEGKNIIVVDWGYWCEGPWYDIAAANCEPVGQWISEFLVKFIICGLLDINNIHLIGHSLGSHVVGACGERMKKAYSLEIPRITALDTASPLFEEWSGPQCDKDDAKFVDCWHTNGWLLGYEKPHGDMDFYPNGGRTQPGCGIDLTGSCAHSMCIDYIVNSIKEPGRYPSRHCYTYEDYKNGHCHTSDHAKMNMSYHNNLRHPTGNYYCHT